MWEALLTSTVFFMQTMILWEVLWAEDYWKEMNCWTAAMGDGEQAHTSVRGISR